jgi:hypothetical protein
MKSAQLAALFSVQKYHARRAAAHQRAAQRMAHARYSKADRRGSEKAVKGRASALRSAAMHRRFIDAITPFLMPPSVPYGPTGSVCLCALSYLFASFFC